MTTKLTKTILRDAAHLLNDHGEMWSEHKFMCHVVVEAGGDRGEFEALLTAHGVSRAGALHDLSAVARRMTDSQRQALRFTFLLLLAESL